MSYVPRHSAARKYSGARRRSPLPGRVVGVAIAASATFVTGIGLSAPAQAGGLVWDVVAACESGGNWAISTGNGYYGGLQFSSSTWKAFGGGQYAPSAHQAGKSAQIGIARRVLAVQGPGAWPVCSKRAGLSRANGSAGGYAMTVSRSRTRTAVAVRGRLAVDGVMGPKTIRQIQRWVGAPATGTLGPITAKALQRKVGAHADGLIGPRTVRALQTRIGARRDGSQHMTVATVSALQTSLNRR